MQTKRRRKRERELFLPPSLSVFHSSLNMPKTIDHRGAPSLIIDPLDSEEEEEEKKKKERQVL